MRYISNIFLTILCIVILFCSVMQVACAGAGGGVYLTAADVRFLPGDTPLDGDNLQEAIEQLFDENNEFEIAFANRLLDLHGNISNGVFSANAEDNTKIDISGFEVMIRGMYYEYPGGTAIDMGNPVGVNGVLIAYDANINDLVFIFQASILEPSFDHLFGIASVQVNPATREIGAVGLRVPNLVNGQVRKKFDYDFGTHYNDPAGIITENATTPFTLDSTGDEVSGNANFSLERRPMASRTSFPMYIWEGGFTGGFTGFTNIVPEYYTSADGTVQTPLTNNWFTPHILYHYTATNDFYLYVGQQQYFLVEDALNAPEPATVFDFLLGFGKVAKVVMKGQDLQVFQIVDRRRILFTEL